MPRFPHSDSFPTAKEFIACFLRDELTFKDLRVVLFWLGFGLLTVPSSEDPIMSLVPFCKDLHTYADTALELGYDPTSSVHEHPVPLFALGAGTGCGLVGAYGCSCGANEARNGGHGHDAATKSGVVPGSSSSHSSSSSSAGLAAGSAAAAPGGPLDVAAPFNPRRGVKQAWRRGVQQSRTEDVGQAAAPSGLWPLDEDDPPQESLGLSRKASMHAGSYDEDAARNAEPSPYTGGATSSLGGDVGADGGNNTTLSETEAAEALAYKVKLMHAGGWSSDGSTSDGSGTPPAPPASSSANAAAAPSSSAGGLDADHVEQFTVTFVPDLQWHEDVEEDIAGLCTFCLEDMRTGEQLCRLPCMHTFHRRCVHAWLERDRRCMLCRLDITRPCG